MAFFRPSKTVETGHNSIALGHIAGTKDSEQLNRFFFFIISILHAICPVRTISAFL
jgi:hypothetical protein